MRPFKLALLCFCTLASADPATRDPLTLTLPQLIDMALERNIDIALAQIDVRTFESQYKQAIGAVIGDLKATAGYERNIKRQAAFLNIVDPVTGLSQAQKWPVGADNSFSAGLGFEQPLFSGGRISSGIHATRTRISAGEQAVRAAREDVIFAVKQLFYSYLLARSTTQIQEDNLKLATEHLTTIRERFRQGLDSDLIVLRQEVEVAAARTALIQSQNLADLAVTNLQKTLVMDVDTPLVPVGALDPPAGTLPAYEAVTKTAMANSAELAVARKRTIVARDFHKYYEADRYPDIKGYANYDWMAQSDDFSPGSNQRNDSLGAGVRLEWKFFTGGETRQRIAQAHLEIQRAEQEEIRVEREVRVRIKQEWLSLNEAKERSRAQEAAVGQAKRALEATETRYKLGHASQLELNDATFALNRARTVFAQASHDYWVANAGLENVVGRRMEEIQ